MKREDCLETSRRPKCSWMKDNHWERRVLTIQTSFPYTFNLEFTLCCGQAFRWNKQGGWWYGVIHEKACKIRQESKTLEFEGVKANLVRDYFRLHDDLPKILRQINRDKNIGAAISKFKGLHILRQEPWECLISYICATYKSISAIKHMLAELCKRFGERTYLEEHEFYTFPKPATLAQASMADLTACGLGYRAEYVSQTAKLVSEDSFDLEGLRRTSYERAKEELTELPGIGPKAADCILLFSLDKLEAFPVDVWIRRAIVKYYSGHFPNEFVEKLCAQRTLSRLEYEKISSFGRDYFGRYAGYAQEYLYHQERMQ